MKRSATYTLILPLAFSCLAMLAGGCSIKMSSLAEKEKELKENPCRRELESLQTKIKQIDSAEGLEADIRGLTSIFKSMDPACEAEEELFGYTLKHGRKNLHFLVAVGYALYRGSIHPVTGERQQWTLEIWKDELRKKMLFEADRMRNRYRKGEISEEGYRNYIQPMIDFAVWSLRTLWIGRSTADFPNMNPSEILVEDLEYLSHSTSTMLIYYSLFAEHEILGNYRNFDMMRQHQNRLLKDSGERCSSLQLLAESNLPVLNLRHPLSIQSGVNLRVPEHLQSPTMSPAFVRNAATGDILKNLMIQVPNPPDSPYLAWPSGFSYILKPIISTSGKSAFIKARLKNDRQGSITERERILQLLGKIEIEPFVEITAELRNPELYRLVGYITTNWLEEAEQICDVSMARLPASP